MNIKDETMGEMGYEVYRKLHLQFSMVDTGGFTSLPALEQVFWHEVAKCYHEFYLKVCDDIISVEVKNALDREKLWK